MKSKKIQITREGLKEAKISEWILRFVFGGLVSLAAGWVGQEWGPVVGGLFLGFPSILPATVTLVKQHNGRSEAADDARGAIFGSLALVGFALIVSATAESLYPLASLGLATLAWGVLSVVLWWVLD